MAQTLEEFLVSVKYQIDAPSQQRFFDALKRVSTSVAGVAGEITGLGIGILKLSETMSAAGEKLYWTSQRIGDSVTGIQGFAFAMSNLGESSDQALANLERFGAWTRNMGPAATSYLRSLGVTATDALGQMKQLGDYFRRTGGTYGQQGTLEYALSLRRAQMMGIDERTMLALSSGQMASGLQQAGIIQRLVWGKDPEKAQKEYAAQSLAVQNQFRQMGFFFQALEQQFASGLFAKVEPELRTINVQLQQMLPDIQAFLNHIISYAPAALHFLEGAIHAFDTMIALGSVAMETFDKLPRSLEVMLGAMIALPKALNLARSPLFMMIAGFTALLYLIDDYQHFQKDPHTASINWNKLEFLTKPFGDLAATIGQFAEGHQWMVGILAGIAALGGKFGWLGTQATTALGPIGLIVKALEVIAAVYIGNKEGQNAIKQKAEEMGWEQIDAPNMFSMPTFRNKKTGEVINYGEMMGKQGLAHGGGGWIERGLQWLWDRAKNGPENLRPQQHSSLGLGGTYLTAGDNWAGVAPAGFGGDIDSDRMFDMLRTAFANVNDKLSDIFDTLTAMATQMGVAGASLPGGGSGSDESTWGPMLGPHASAEEQEARLAQIQQRESGGRNVWNYKHASNPGYYTASGYYQMIDSTWAHAARLAGIDVGAYPHAIDAPWDLQHRAALALINEQGERPWQSSVRHQPLGADGAYGGASGGAGFAGQFLNKRHDLHNQTTINVVAPSPGSAAAQVAEVQERTFEHHIRFARGVLT